LNRAVRRDVLFADADDYRAFLKILKAATARFGMRVLAYAVMPNHWHLVVWPDADLQLSRFMHWLTLVHTKRWHAGRGTTGTGPLYQGRYKAVPVQSDEHLLTAIRYVERNPLRAGLVSRAQDWPWSSVRARQRADRSLISDGPVVLPGDWLATLNAGRDGMDLDVVRDAVRRSIPVGDAIWRPATALAFGLKATLQSPGRPRRN
jgi:putative transposase